MLTKACTKCGVEKGVDQFSRRLLSKDGLQPLCKQCVMLYKKQYYAQNKDVVSTKGKIYRTANAAIIKAREKLYHEKNKDKIRQKKKEYREKNRDATLTKKKEHYRANREAILIQSRVYREVNKETIAEKRSAYQKANRHIGNATNARRKALKRHATPAWADKEAIDSLYLIAAINRERGLDLHVDHIVPLQSNIVCGLHCEANLKLMLASDNIRKNNRYWPDMP